MAVKAYDKTRDIYKWEKEAFSGLRNDDDTRIAQCLGSFSHDDGERKTYNLLLEYGELDLDEYCADPNIAAPVRSEEIIWFWRSLFEVAKAIRTVHEVGIKRGKKTWFYNG